MPLQNEIINEEMFYTKEIANMIELKCKKCGEKYNLRSCKGSAEIL
jgi:hypothetical protein